MFILSTLASVEACFHGVPEGVEVIGNSSYLRSWVDSNLSRISQILTSLQLSAVKLLKTTTKQASGGIGYPESLVPIQANSPDSTSLSIMLLLLRSNICKLAGEGYRIRDNSNIESMDTSIDRKCTSNWIGSAEQDDMQPRKATVILSCCRFARERIWSLPHSLPGRDNPG